MEVPAVNRSSGGGASQPVANSAPVPPGVGGARDQIAPAPQAQSQEPPPSPRGFFEKIVRGACGFVGKIFTPVYNLVVRILRPFWNCLVNIKNKLFSKPSEQTPPPPLPQQSPPASSAPPPPQENQPPLAQPGPQPQPPSVEQRRDLFKEENIDPKKLLNDLQESMPTMPVNPEVLYRIFEYVVDSVDVKDSTYRLLEPIERGWLDKRTREERGRDYALKNPSALIPHLIGPLDKYVKTYCRS